MYGREHQSIENMHEKFRKWNRISLSSLGIRNDCILNLKKNFMKRLSLVFAAAVALMACGDNSGSETGTGGSIDSASTSPGMNSTDNTTMQGDSIGMDSQSVNPGTGATGTGGTGAAGTGSGNSGTDNGAGGAGSSSGGTGSSGTPGAGGSSTGAGTGSSGSGSTDNSGSTGSGSGNSGSTGSGTSGSSGQGGTTDNNQSK
jgi:hypothetical protein